MLKLRPPDRHLYLIIFTALTLGLLSYLGFIQQLALRLELNLYIIITAIMLIPLTTLIHIPIRRIQVIHAIPPTSVVGLIIPKRSLYRGYTLITLNVGGAVLPASYSIILYLVFPIPTISLLIILLITTMVSFLLSRPIPGFGIGLPIFSVPIIAALTTHYLIDEYVISTAYIAATIGVMLGADALRLLRPRDIQQLGSSFVSIGGAGILDSIVLTGFISIILVSLF